MLQNPQAGCQTAHVLRMGQMIHHRASPLLAPDPHMPHALPSLYCRYLQYAKLHGFESMLIWACPPLAVSEQPHCTAPGPTAPGQALGRHWIAGGSGIHRGFPCVLCLPACFAAIHVDLPLPDTRPRSSVSCDCTACRATTTSCTATPSSRRPPAPTACESGTTSCSNRWVQLVVYLLGVRFYGGSRIAPQPHTPSYPSAIASGYQSSGVRHQAPPLP